jgi:pilus assembly protein CpaB
MRLSTIIIIVAALGVSILTAFLIQMYLGSQAPSVEATKEVIPAERVLVAKADLPGGTVLKAKDHFKWQAWPAQGLNKNYVLKGSDLEKEFVGAVVRRQIKAGSPISNDLVYRTGEKGFLASGLKPGMLAVAIKVDPIVGVAGLVTPGDYVDVILTTTISVGWDVTNKKIPRVNESRKVSETILRNVRILAVNQNADKQGKATKKPKSATLEVTEKQAEILANVRRMGKLFLALRSHVQSEVPREMRNYPFTTDLEVLSSLRGGLVSHINEQNNLAMREFGLKRWLDESDSAAAATPGPVIQPAAPPVSKPKIRIQSPALKPKAGVSSANTPKATLQTGKPAKSSANAVTKIEKPIAKPATRPVVQSAPKPVAPVVTTTVRVDRAGNVQTLKFKEAQ